MSLVAVRAEVTKRAEPGQKQKAVRGHIPFTPRAKKVLELALREALKLGNNYIGTEHILIADGSRASSRTKGQDASTAQLLTRLSEMTSQLVKDELRLATAELTPKGKKAGMGAGLFGGAGVTALFGVGALVACAILALDLVLSVWLAALLVGARHRGTPGQEAGQQGASGEAGRKPLTTSRPISPR